MSGMRNGRLLFQGGHVLLTHTTRELECVGRDCLP